MSSAVADLVSRLQRRMLWLAAGLAIAYGILGPTRGLVVLTLSVATAIVHLRWLASHVLSLSAPALSATGPSSDRQETRTDASATSLEATSDSHGSVENADQPDPGTDLGVESHSAPIPVAPESEDYASESIFGSGGSAPQNDRQPPIEVSTPSEDSGAEPSSFSMKAGVIAALTRLPLLLAIVIGLVYVGHAHPLALALGLGTLPVAMVFEAWTGTDTPTT